MDVSEALTRSEFDALSSVWSTTSWPACELSVNILVGASERAHAGKIRHAGSAADATGSSNIAPSTSDQPRCRVAADVRRMAVIVTPTTITSATLLIVASSIHGAHAEAYSMANSMKVFMINRLSVVPLG